MTLDEMKERLIASFPDAEIDLRDPSGTGSNVAIRIETKAFEGLNRVKQHQAVMAVFADELKTGELHALSIQSKVKETSSTGE